MGLIREVISNVGRSISGTIRDSYKDVIECPNMGNNILMMKKTTESGRISRKSIILVQPAQMVVIIDSGRVIDATAEEGAYLFDESTTPSFFAGDFGASFRDMWERFTFGGANSKQQAVYFFNMKEITDNKFGTTSPVNFSDWMHAVSNPRIPGGLTPMSVQLKCRGSYTFKLADPPTFMREIAGTAAIYEKTEIINQMKMEVLASFQSVLNRMGSREFCVGANDLLSKTNDIKTIMNQEVFDESIRNRGIRIVSFIIEAVDIDAESKRKIDQWEFSSDQLSQQGRLVESYSNAMEGAATNSAGAMNGFMGLGIMNMGTGGFMGNIASQTGAAMTGMGQQGMNGQGTMGMQQGMPQAMQLGAMGMQQNTTQNAATRMCPNCHIPVPGKFCPECGAKFEEEKQKICPKCGAQVQGKFCTECGAAVEEPSVIMCPDCHIEVPGKFCPNCGRKMQ